MLAAALGPGVSTDRRLVAVCLVTAAMLGVMFATDRGLVPAFAASEPVWWLLPPLALGYWVAWVRWSEAES